LKSEGFRVLAIKKKSLVLHVVEQLIKKKEECMILGFLEEGGVFLFLTGCPHSLPSFFLYPMKP
jgi:IS4 transposase